MNQIVGTYILRVSKSKFYLRIFNENFLSCFLFCLITIRLGVLVV